MFLFFTYDIWAFGFTYKLLDTLYKNARLGWLIIQSIKYTLRLIQQIFMKRSIFASPFSKFKVK